MTWRERVATLEQYADIGQYRVRSLRDALLSGMAVKYLFWPEMPVALAALCAIPLYALFCAIGFAYKRWGWLVHSSTVAARQQLSRSVIVELVHRRRLFDRLAIPWDDIPKEVPHEVLEVLEVPEA